MTDSKSRLFALGVLAALASVSLWAWSRAAPDEVDRSVNKLLSGGIEGAVVALGPLGQAPEVRVYGNAGQGASKSLSGDSRFRFASLTKPVVSAAVNELAARGVIALDDTLPDHLPEFSFSDPRFQSVTIRDLLRHTSGIEESVDFHPLFSTSEELLSKTALVANTQQDCSGIAMAMAGRTLANPAAAVTAYSNTGYCFLGLVIEARNGLTLEDAIHDLVPEAAALSFDADSVDVTHDVPAEEQDFLVLRPLVAGAAGGLIGSPVDYHEFLARPLRDGVTDPPPFETEDNNFWGMGWRVWPDLDCPKRTHFGSMPGAYSVAMVDAANNGFVVFFNGRPAEDWPPFAELVQAACSVLR